MGADSPLPALSAAGGYVVPPSGGLLSPPSSSSSSSMSFPVRSREPLACGTTPSLLFTRSYTPRGNALLRRSASSGMDAERPRPTRGSGSRFRVSAVGRDAVAGLPGTRNLEPGTRNQMLGVHTCTRASLPLVFLRHSAFDIRHSRSPAPPFLSCNTQLPVISSA